MMMSLNIAKAICCLFFTISLTSGNAEYQQTTANNLDNDPNFDAGVSEQLAKNILTLGQEIGTTVLQDSDKRTEMFSPLSIYAALSMIMMGSNGQTFQELMNLLKISNDSYLANNSWKVHQEFGLLIDDLSRESPNPLHNRPKDYWQIHRRPPSQWARQTPDNDPRSYQQINVANGIFIQNGYSIRPDYREAVESVYRSTLQRLDFLNKSDLSTKYINRWVDEKTQGKIKQMFSQPLHPLTKIVIVSALYFKATWAKTFFEGSTTPKPFYPDGLDKPSITVDMMAQGGAYPFYESKEYDCRIIGLPYRKNLTTMFVILPNNSNRQRLRQLQATLTGDKMHDMISKMEWKTAILVLPKLQITNEINLKTVLNRMGLRTLFRNGQSDLSLISSGEQLDSDISSPLNDQHQHQYPSQNDQNGQLSNNNESQFLFTRFNENSMSSNRNVTSVPNRNSISGRKKRSAVTYKASSNFHSAKEPLRLKDLVIGKRITKSYPRKKNVSRVRRQTLDGVSNLKRLDSLRLQPISSNADLFADELVHKVDLTINEYGTEGGAATTTILRRNGPDIIFRTETPFLLLIRHDETKLPIFYGAVFEPTNN